MTAQVGEFIPNHRLLLVSVNEGTKDRHLIYDAARYAWRLNRKKAQRVELVLACVHGIVKGVFIPTEWLDASPGEETRAHFSDLLDANPRFVPRHNGHRLGFRGVEADEATIEVCII